MENLVYKDWENEENWKMQMSGVSQNTPVSREHVKNLAEIYETETWFYKFCNLRRPIELIGRSSRLLKVAFKETEHNMDTWI